MGVFIFFLVTWIWCSYVFKHRTWQSFLKPFGSVKSSLRYCRSLEELVRGGQIRPDARRIQRSLQNKTAANLERACPRGRARKLEPNQQLSNYKRTTLPIDPQPPQCGGVNIFCQLNENQIFT